MKLLLSASVIALTLLAVPVGGSFLPAGDFKSIIASEAQAGKFRSGRKAVRKARRNVRKLRRKIRKTRREFRRKMRKAGTHKWGTVQAYKNKNSGKIRELRREKRDARRDLRDTRRDVRDERRDNRSWGSTGKLKVIETRRSDTGLRALPAATSAATTIR